MKRPVSRPKPAASEAATGTHTSAASGETRLLRIAASSRRTVARPSNGNCVLATSSSPQLPLLPRCRTFARSWAAANRRSHHVHARGHEDALLHRAFHANIGAHLDVRQSHRLAP